MTNKTGKRVIESDDAYVVLMNTTFKDSEIEHSDIGTCYLSSRAVKRILKDLESLGYVQKDPDQSLPKEPDTYYGLRDVRGAYQKAQQDMRNAGWIKIRRLV